MAEMFTKYRKDDGKSRILLLYLILNNYDLSKIDKVMEVTQEKKFGSEFKKVYGETSEFVDVSRIESELAAIRIPVICSPQSFEIYSNAQYIHSYRPKVQEKPLYINDMGVISPLMIITEDCIVSSNVAETVENAKEKGFMHFVKYVLDGECKISDWTITFHEKEFKIFYTSRKDNEEKRELLYHAVELDQTSTFKLVLYIISKAANEMDEFPPDNFTEEVWKLEKKQ